MYYSEYYFLKYFLKLVTFGHHITKLAKFDVSSVRKIIFITGLFLAFGRLILNFEGKYYIAL